MDTLIRLLIILFLSWFTVQDSPVETTPEPAPTQYTYTTITDVQAITLRSFPAQINLVISGYQPDGCDIPVQVSQRREGNTVYVDIYRDLPQSVMCPAILREYSESIHLDGFFESGTYTIRVNDFTLEVTV
ncbi:MAG: hypothetical protein IT319_17780 [Anaerolineae bacterium]|nr:hypothetical protein [Anaerolineae bacterium]